MPLHPKIAEILASFPAPEPGPLNPDAMRAGEESQVAPVADRQPLHSVEDLTASTEIGEIPVRVYRPTAESAQAKGGVIVYFHGGAFFLGSLNTHDHIARAAAAASGLTVVSVGYRLAPEHAYPAGLDDCYAVTRWVAGEGAEVVGFDGSTLALLGDSSGGTFVAAVAARALDEGFNAITHQVLYYPSLDLDFDESRYASLVENAVGYGLETAGLKPFNAFYIDSGANPDDPAVSPIKRADLTGLPKTLIITGELDPLRDEGELFGKLLAEAGVDATVSRYDSAGHGFIQHFGWLPEYGAAFAETADFINGEATA